MEYVKLGRAGVQVSRLILGTANLGWKTDEPTAHELLDRAWEAGIQTLDTANIYGGVQGEGITEQILGRWLALHPGRRDEVVLATKVFSTMGPLPNQGKLSAWHIVRACEDSLRRLQTDRIDLYQMHHVDRNTPWDEIWQAMDTLVDQGKVLYVGSSNFAGWHLAACQEAAKRRQRLGLVSDQSTYSLANRAIESDILPACEAYGLGVIPYGPTQSGMLAGQAQAGGDGRRDEGHVQRRAEKQAEQLEQWHGLCAELGEEPATVAIAWVLQQPAVTAPIIGPRTVAQLAGCLRALDTPLPPEMLQRLDQVWPGPGVSPERYAW